MGEPLTNDRSLLLAASRLTARQVEVLTAFANGMSCSEAAKALFVSVSTLKTHAENARERLGVKSTTHAVAIAVAAGAVQVHPHRQEEA